MSHPKRREIEERDLAGFKYFKKIARLLERLHDAGCARDRAHNRLLHMGQHLGLLRSGNVGAKLAEFKNAR